MSRAKDVQSLPLASSSAERAFVTERAASPEGLNKGSDNEDLEEEPEVKNLKYWATKIGHVFRKVRPTKKRRKTSYGSLFSSLGGEYSIIIVRQGAPGHPYTIPRVGDKK